MPNFQNEHGRDDAGVSQMQDKLTGMLIGLARATEGNDHMLSDSTAAVVVEGLLAENLDNAALPALLERVDGEKRKLVPGCYTCASACGRTDNYDMARLRNADAPIRSLKLQLLSGIRGIAADAHRAAELGWKDEKIHYFLYKGLFAIGMDDWGVEELEPILLEAEEMKARCMALLDKRNTTPTAAPTVQF